MLGIDQNTEKEAENPKSWYISIILFIKNIKISKYKHKKHTIYAFLFSLQLFYINFICEKIRALKFLGSFINWIVKNL